MATIPFEHVWIVYIVHHGTRTALHAFYREPEARRWADSRAETARNLNTVITVESLTIK